MAPYLEPLTLYRSALAAASTTIDDLCNKIFLDAGTYGSDACMSAVARLQSYLISSVPLSIFEHLLEDRNSRIKRCALFWSKDPRIKLAVFLHPSITKFGVDGKGNEMMLMNPEENGGLDDFFWSTHLRHLGNLVFLNMNLVTTDELLILIGSSCPKLEHVNIVSRIKQETAYVHSANPVQQIGAAADGGAPPPVLINQQPPGIVLRYCVSDVGLNALLSCKQLRKIIMDRNANNGLTCEGVRGLVQGLPRLESITFGQMGKVLSKGIHEPIRLKHFIENNTYFVEASTLERLCPELSQVQISVSPLSDEDENRRCDLVLQELAKSKLALTCLDVERFPECRGITDLLVAKGSILTELYLKPSSRLSLDHLILVGESCPRLQKLTFRELTTSHGVGVEMHSAVSEALKKEMFGDLKILCLQGKEWNPDLVLPLLLSSAKGINKLSLMNINQRRILDPSVIKVLSLNGLTRLQSLFLNYGCAVSMPMVHRLAFDCPRLSLFSFILTETMEVAEVERLRLDVARKNLNIKLCCLEVT